MHGIEAFSGRLGVPPTDENERGRQDVGSVQRCREHGCQHRLGFGQNPTVGTRTLSVMRGAELSR
jgi:hypothetical protein